MKKSEVVEEKLTVAMNKVAEFVGRPVVFLTTIVIFAAWFIASSFLSSDGWSDTMEVTILLAFIFLLYKLDEIIDALQRAQTSKKGEEKRLKRGKAKR